MRFRGRARRLQIHRGAADDAVAAWADNGGRIGLIAPERCGRTFLLGRATRTLSRLGTPYVHVDALGLPWGGVVSALDRLGEPPPWEVPADERAAVIAAQLHRHCLTGLRLIVDDVERQDPGTLRVLDRLADLGASMLVAGTRGPAWASRLVDIPPLASATDLLEAALRDRSAAEQLAGPASRTCEGAPGRVLDWLERALVAGAIAPRAGRWEVRAELLPTDAAPAPIPDDAAEVEALAAASRASMPASLLAQALGADLADVMRAIESLADRALVRFSGDLVTPTGPRAVELLRSAKAPSSALVALCERELERPGGDVIRAAWLAIESERPDVLGRAAPAAARRAAAGARRPAPAGPRRTRQRPRRGRRARGPASPSGQATRRHRAGAVRRRGPTVAAGRRPRAARARPHLRAARRHRERPALRRAAAHGRRAGRRADRDGHAGSAPAARHRHGPAFTWSPSRRSRRTETTKAPRRCWPHSTSTPWSGGTACCCAPPARA